MQIIVGSKANQSAGLDESPSVVDPHFPTVTSVFMRKAPVRDVRTHTTYKKKLISSSIRGSHTWIETFWQ